MLGCMPAPLVRTCAAYLRPGTPACCHTSCDARDQACGISTFITGQLSSRHRSSVKLTWSRHRTLYLAHSPTFPDFDQTYDVQPGLSAGQATGLICAFTVDEYAMDSARAA